MTNLLTDPPGFPADGSHPPLTSEPLVVADVVGTVTLKREPRWRDRLVTSLPRRYLPASYEHLVDLSVQYKEWTELRRYVYQKYWRRGEQIYQLAPGVSTEESITFTVGISEEQSTELGTSLSANTKVDGKILAQEAASQWEQRTGHKVTFQQECQVSKKVTLENKAGTSHRKIAVWRIHHSYTVSRLDGIELTRKFTDSELEQLRNISAIWVPVYSMEISVDEALTTTGIDF